MKRILVPAVFIICATLVHTADKVYKMENDAFIIEPKQEFNFFEAEAICKQHKMNLATLDTEAKAKQLQKVLKNMFLDKNQKIPKMYIGATDLGEFRKFVWITTGKSFSYTNWDTNEPNNFKNTNERCVQMGDSGTDKWNDIVCSKKFGYICEAIKKLNNKNDNKNEV